MRYEVMRLLQFVFSLSLVLAAFGGGVFVGWRRWGRQGPVDHSQEHDSAAPAGGLDGDRFEVLGRRDLFAPELDIDWSDPAIDLRVAPRRHLGLPAATGATASAGASAPEALA